MTFRARPTTKPTTRARRNPGGDHRRNLYMNIGFGAVVVLAVVLFAGAALGGWYDQHFSAAATVNGVKITKDQVAQRIKIETFRLQQWADRTRAKATAGRMPGSQAQSLISYIDSLKSNLDSAALGYEEDSELIRQLAAKQGIAIADADVDAQVTKDATIPESRHTYAIALKPEVSTGATTSTDAQKQATKAKADGLLAGLKSGTSWEDTVKASGDTDAASTNGDLYFIDKDSTSPDADFVKAIFALPANGYTEVVEGSDGAYRIGRLTEVVPASVDPKFNQALSDAGIDMGDYRTVDKSYVAHDKIEAKLLAEVATTPTEQRRVTKILLSDNDGQPAAADAVLVRHLLFAPNDDAQAAAALKPDDPAWATAKQQADDAYAKLKAGTARFVDLAAKSDDTGSAAQNGILGFEDSSSGLDSSFAAAIFRPGVASGQLLEPVKSAFGWHVIQVMWAPGSAAGATGASPSPGAASDPAAAYLAAVQAAIAAPGANLATIAADNSVDPTAAKGGDIGWVAKHQLGSSDEQQIFGLAKGVASTPTLVTSPDGSSAQSQIYVVTDVQTRLPDEAQLATLRSNAFTNWYSTVKTDPTQANIVEATAAPSPSP